MSFLRNSANDIAGLMIPWHETTPPEGEFTTYGLPTRLIDRERSKRP